ATLFSAPAAVVATSELVLDLTLEGLFDQLSNPEPHKLRPKVAPAVLHSVRQQHFNPLAGPLRCRYSLAHGDASLLRFGANRSRFRFSHRRGCIPSLFPANLGHHRTGRAPRGARLNCCRAAIPKAPTDLVPPIVDPRIGTHRAFDCCGAIAGKARRPVT